MLTNFVHYSLEIVITEIVITKFDSILTSELPETVIFSKWDLQL